MKQNKEVVFATNEGNQPKIRIFQIMRQEATTLYFATSSQKEVYRQLQKNPHVEILTMANDVSVRCSGKVSFDVDDKCRQWIYNNNPVLPRLYSSYDKLVYFSLAIEEMDYYDLRPTPPILRHFNLREGTEGTGFVGERFSKNDNNR
ncbi:pyridoxamine 5'-phosphate oxidase family protein [Prevotella falsenii]|uniref:pyridoxamine 5'-phosphate oxidase family protein n=1 Tax=Prevotella falsenii TaxID=515414 RepID=UPI001E2F2C4F|nr:pyridoxamine 5'-phosphate oxidase family protein [Prevotella falsenii]